MPAAATQRGRVVTPTPGELHPGTLQGLRARAARSGTPSVKEAGSSVARAEVGGAGHARPHAVPAAPSTKGSYSVMPRDDLVATIERLPAPLAATLTQVWRRGKRAAFAVQRLRYHRVVRLRALDVDWVLDLRDGLQRELASTGDYEREVREALLEELRDGDVFIDIGANIGVLSLPIAKRRPSVAIVAFEPMPMTAQKLREASARAGCENVTLVEVALGDAPGRLTLRKDPWFGNRDTGVVSAFGIGRPAGVVPVRTLDEVVEELGLGRADVIKIDIEGGEHQAILGMSRVLRELHPRLLIVEIQPDLLRRAGVAEGSTEEVLRKAGYVVQQRLDRNVLFRPVEA